MVSRHTLEGEGAAPFAEQVLESETLEVWQAWLDGDKDNAEFFFVPVAGTHDVGELAAG